MTNKTLSGRGGARAGAGRPKGTKKPIKPESEKAKKYTFWLYQWEVETVRQFVKNLRLKGAKTMNNIELTKEDIIDLMAHYVAGSEIDFSIFGNKENEVGELFALYNRAFSSLEADPEGFNPEQQKEADALDEDYANRVLALLN